MKTTNQFLTVLCALTLTACQAGKVSSTLNSKNQATNNSVNTAVIDLGNLNSGQDLGVQTNPTPVPAPSVVIDDYQSQSAVEIKSSTLFAMMNLISIFSTDAQAGPMVSGAPVIQAPEITNPSIISGPDTFQFYSTAALLTKLQAVVGLTQLNSFQNIYNNYSATLVSTPSAVAPSDLLKPVTLSFTSSNGKVSSLTVSLLTLLKPYVSVITKGDKAYIGEGLIKAANSSVAAVPLANLSGATFLQIGSTSIKVFGGTNSLQLNRNLASIILNVAGTFTISTSLTTLSTSASLANIVVKPIDSTLASAAGLTAGHIGNHALIANINQSNKITGFSLFKLNSGVISTPAITCASIVNKFPGYTCNTGISTSTSTSTATSTAISTFN